MKIKDVIAYVDAIKPNAFPDEVKVQWINEAEGFIQTDVMLLDIREVVRYEFPKDRDTELLVIAPHSKIYYAYLTAMVDFANGEYDKYANTMQMYNEFLNEYMAWFADHYRPADGMAVAHGYYISAYGIAVAHGFSGTEEQWIKSLTGPAGEPFKYSDFTPEQLDALRGPAGKDFEYEDFTPEQLESLRGRPGDPGVFVKESPADEPDDSDTVMVDVTPEEAEEILIPDSLLREGDNVWLMCEDEKLGTPFVIKDGKNGADGKNFRILGYYGSIDLLRSSVPNPEIGDAYGVGTAAPYNVYVYDGVALDWIDNGSLAGVAGADGVGIRSIEQTTVSSEDGGTNVITITLTDDVKYTFEVKNGRAGTDGKSANLTVGTVTTGAAGSEASASITGTAPNYKLNLVIPKGENGKNGSDASIKIDSEMSDTSTNAVENKVIKAYIDGIVGDVDAAIAEIETILGGA